MAFDATKLSLLNVAPGYCQYLYDAETDTMAQVMAGSYFDTGPGSAPGLVADDYIFCRCTDGNMLLRVDQVVAASGLVSCFYAGGDLPTQTPATGTEAALAKLKVGYYEVGTSVATATRYVLPTPYPGAVVHVRKIDSGTQGIHFDAGASGSDVSLDASDGAAGGGTAVTFDGSNRRILLQAETEGFRVRATSTSRWRIEALAYNASAVSEGGSVVMPGT